MADVTATFAAKDESFAKTVDKLQGRLTQFSGGVSSFNSKVSGMAASFAKFAVPIAGIAAAFFGAKAAADAFGSALAMGGRLDDLSKRTKASAGEMLLLEKAFDLAGSSAEAVGPTISKLNRFLAEASVSGSAQDDTLRGLGLTYDKLSKQSPAEQMKMIAERIASIRNPAMQTQAAMAVFGKTGGELIPLLSDFSGELNKARGFLGSLPDIMTENAAAFADLDDNIQEVRKKFDQFVAGLITGLVPALTSVTKRIANLDAAGFGKAISDYVTRTLEWAGASLGLSKALDNVKTAIDGVVTGSFGAGMSLMFLTARDTAFRAINQILAAAQAALQSVVSAIGFIFRPNSVTMGLIEEAAKLMGATIASNISTQLGMVLEGFVSTVPELLRPIANFMADSFLPGMSFMGRQMQGMLDDLSTSSITNKLNEAAKDFAKTAKTASLNFKGLLGPVAKELATAFRNIPKNFAQSYKENLQNPLIDMRDMTKQTADEAERLQRAVRAAAFNAQEFGAAMKDARVDRFAGTEAPPFMGQDKGTHLDPQGRERPGSMFPHQGGGPSGAEAEPLPANDKDTKTKTVDNEGGMSDRMARGANAVNDILDKMRETHHFGQRTQEEIYNALRDGGQSIYDATKNAGKEFADQSQASTDMRKMESKALNSNNSKNRAMDRAARLEANGQDGAANSIRRRAEAKFTKEMEKLAPTAKGAKDELKVGADALADAVNDKGGGSGPGHDPVLSAVNAIEKFLSKTFFDDFKKRLPQNALS